MSLPEQSEEKGEEHYLGHRQRLRERFLKAGFAGFADHEIIELLLTLAIPRGDVKERVVSHKMSMKPGSVSPAR